MKLFGSSAAIQNSVGQMTQGIGFALPSVESDGAVLTTILDFGAKMDGSDDSLAIQLALLETGIAIIPKGVATVALPIVMPQDSAVMGMGMGLSTIKASASFSRTDKMFFTESPKQLARYARNVTFSNLTIDGSAVAQPDWPAAGYDDSGYLLYLNAVDKFRLDQVEFTGAKSYAVASVGCRNGVVRGCEFRGNGNPHAYSPAFSSKAFGTMFSVASITRANPAVMKLYNHAATFPANATTVKIVGVSWLADGIYSITSAGTNLVNLTGVNTSAQPNPYVTDLTAYAGYSGTTGDYFFPSEELLVESSHFRDNKFHNIAFSSTVGGAATGNTLVNGGESAIFVSTARSIALENNKVKGTHVAAVIANGFEVNTSANINMSGNVIEDTATDAIGSNNMQNVVISGNTFNRIITDSQVAFPPGPDYPSGGPVIGATSVIRLNSRDEFPGSNIQVTGNTVMDLRLVPQASRIVVFARTGTGGFTNNVFDIAVANNNFGQSGIAPANQIICLQNDATIPERMRFSKNLGHGSEGPVVIEVVSPVSGVVDYNIGFVPSCILIDAYAPATATAWLGRTVLTKGKSGGVGHRDSVTAATNARIARVNDIAYEVATDAGTVQARGLFSSWNCQSTKGIGFSLNHTIVTLPVNLVMVCFP